MTLPRITERRARYAMGFSALLMMGVTAAFNTGLISRTPAYTFQAWYLVSSSNDYLITTEYADESTCRQKEQSAKVCRSGAAMMAQALSDQKPASGP